MKTSLRSRGGHGVGVVIRWRLCIYVDRQCAVAMQATTHAQADGMLATTSFRWQRQGKQRWRARRSNRPWLHSHLIPSPSRLAPSNSPMSLAPVANTLLKAGHALFRGADAGASVGASAAASSPIKPFAERVCSTVVLEKDRDYTSAELLPILARHV